MNNPKRRQIVAFSGEVFDLESKLPLNSTMVAQDGKYACFNAHRTVTPGFNPFEVHAKGTFKILKDGTIRKNGFSSHVNPVTGWSLWSPHAVPLPLDGDEGSLCEVLESLPDTLTLVHERNYRVTSANGVTDFAHFLLTVSSESSISQCECYAKHIKSSSCILGARGEPNDLKDIRKHDSELNVPVIIDLDECEDACGDAYACQDVLKRVVQSSKSEYDGSMKTTASILYGWIGSGDLSLELILEYSSWASLFILNCFECMPIDDDSHPDLRVAYATAISTFSCAIGSDDNQFTKENTQLLSNPNVSKVCVKTFKVY